MKKNKKLKVKNEAEEMKKKPIKRWLLAILKTKISPMSLPSMKYMRRESNKGSLWEVEEKAFH